MRARSVKRAAQERRYTKLRREFLDEHPSCEVCGHRATEVHHRAGRQGDRLTDVSRFCALCHACHQFVTEHPQAAIRHGLSLSRFDRKEAS